MTLTYYASWLLCVMATQFMATQDAHIKGFVNIRFTHVCQKQIKMCLIESWNPIARGTCSYKNQVSIMLQ